MAELHNELIELFCAYMAGRSFSPHTIKRRTSSLSSFARFIAPMRLEDVESDNVEEWTATLGAARTRHAYRSDLSAFYAWAVKRKVVAVNPVDGTDPIRVPKGLPHPVPPNAVPTIIAATDDPTLRLALMLAAYAGLRRAEICALTTDDYQLHPTPMLVVRNGKGGKDRQVPLHPALAAALGRRTVQGRLVPWTPDKLGRVARAHIHACGYDYSLHACRHTFATELARVTKGNVIVISKALGHEKADTSMQYIGWSGGDWSPLFGEMYDDRPPAA